MAGPYLATSLRKQLAKTIDQARTVAETGAAEAIRRLAVGDAKAPDHLREPDRRLRTALRAHGRALGDRREPSGAQATAKLTEAAAYEHWHRMLFARFLAERELLIHPEHKVHVTLADCKELAAEEGLPDAWAVAERYAAAHAARHLPPGRSGPGARARARASAGAARAGRRARRRGVRGEPTASAGPTSSGARPRRRRSTSRAGRSAPTSCRPSPSSSPSPTWCSFLLHNTLGAWWAGKVLAAEPELARTAADEPALRAAVRLPGIDWDLSALRPGGRRVAPGRRHFPRLARARGRDHGHGPLLRQRAFPG